MRLKFLLAIAFTICSSAAIASQATQAAASGDCDNQRLKKAISASPQEDTGRAAELERLLVCLGPKADPLLAAGAAYELAMYFAGADGGSSDFSKAARWAHKSVDYLKPARASDLQLKTQLAALRLDYYAAKQLPTSER